MDKISKEKRSWNMSRIKGKDTKPEIQVRRCLYSRGIRYRVHARLPGKPDLVFLKKKICIFINGCYWHMHKDCKNFVVPKTNTDFWMGKIQSNVDRDLKNYTILEKDRWKVLVIWECDVEQRFKSTINYLIKQINYVRTR